MVRSLLFWLVLGFLWPWSAPVPALAQQDPPGERRVVTYNALGIPRAQVVAVASDAANRVWVVTANRVSATVGGARVSLLPFFAAETGLPIGATLRAVTFATPAGKSADGEHFYLGSNRGIAWGRLASTVEFGEVLMFDAGSPADLDAVHGVASDGKDWLWSATDGGLVRWDLSAVAPRAPGDTEIFLDGSGHGAVRSVAAAPWGGVAATDGGHLHLVSAVGTQTQVHDLGSRNFQRIAFAADGSLWAVTTGVGNPILKFAVNGTEDGLVGPPLEYPFTPDNPPGGMLPRDLAVDRITGRVWVTITGANQDAGKNAYHQLPDAVGNLTGGAWERVFNPFDAHTVVHADVSGNIWLGMGGDSTDALNGYVVRLLNLDKSRYLGDTNGVVSLVDYAVFADNGAANETATVTLSVGSESRDFEVIEQDDTGRFTQTFQISPSGAAGGEGSLFLASSTADDVAVEATYVFTDANAAERKLSAFATWANIVPFDDDLWVGGGLCFVRSLGW